ncbi:MAG: hypothetical protein ACLVDW_11485 [Barnesiella intestinihominis]
MENNRFDIREQKISDTEREFEKALRPLAFDDFNGNTVNARACGK